MHMALIQDLQVLRIQGLSQLGPYSALDRPAGVHPRSGWDGVPGERESAEKGTSVTEDSVQHQQILSRLPIQPSRPRLKIYLRKAITKEISNDFLVQSFNVKIGIFNHMTLNITPKIKFNQTAREMCQMESPFPNL